MAGFSYPRVDYKPGGFWGTVTPSSSSSSQIPLIDATDPTNPQAGYWDWSEYGLSAFKNLHIATYTHAGPVGDPGVWNFGGIALTGYNVYDPNATISGCPFLTYPTAEGYTALTWLIDFPHCEHATIDIDRATNMSYAVYDRLNGSPYQLLVRKDDFGAWRLSGNRYDHDLVSVVTIKDSSGNLKFPDVAANNDIILIVCQNDKAGNQDVYCYRSINGFVNSTPIPVATSADDELYPQIEMIDNATVCTYIIDGKIYYRMSYDAGATWEGEGLANGDDTVASEYGAMDLCVAGFDVCDAWQDSRASNLDIYYNDYLGNGGHIPPLLECHFSGGIGKVTVTMQNTVHLTYKDIDWTLTVTGGILHLINISTSGTINALAPKDSTEIQNNGSIFGYGRIQIQVTASIIPCCQMTRNAPGKQRFFRTIVYD